MQPIDILNTIAAAYTVAFVIFCIAQVLWIWTLIYCARRELPGVERVLWIILVLFGNIFGALVYLLLRQPSKRVMDQQVPIQGIKKSW